MHGFLIALLLTVIPVSGVDTRVGTAVSDSPTASIFGSGGEVQAAPHRTTALSPSCLRLRLCRWTILSRLRHLRIMRWAAGR